jgi:uncharacterized protein YecT (DUF1311 family)
LVLGACSSPIQAGLSPVDSTGPGASSAPVATAAKAATEAQSAATQSSVVATKPSARSAALAPGNSAVLKYVKIVEPFGSPGPCQAVDTTIETTACFLQQVVKVDYTVDVLQRQRFEYGTSEAEQKAELRDDASWLAERTKTCSANLSGGSIDQITEAQCLLKVSRDRVADLS